MPKSLFLMSMIAGTMISCSGFYRGAMHDSFQKAEMYIGSRPDSSLAILEEMTVRKKKSCDYATWCILKTWAEYNLYKDIDQKQFEFGTGYFMRHGGNERKALAYYLRAVILQELGKSSSSEFVSDLREGCKAAEKTDSHYISALLNSRYGVEMNDRKWYGQAMDALKKAYGESCAGELFRLQSTILINMSHTALFSGDEDHDYTEALAYAEKACATAEEHGDSLALAKALSAKSSCCSRIGDFDDALKYALQSSHILKQLHRPASNHTAIADAYRKMNMADSAIYYACLDTASANPTVKACGLQLLYTTYRDILHDDKLSVKYLTMYNRLKGEIADSQDSDKIISDGLASERKEEKDRHLKSLAATAAGAGAAIGVLVAATIFLVNAGRRKIRKQDERIIRQTEALQNAVIGMNALVEELQKRPRYLKEDEADALIKTVDAACDNYCSELSSSHPELTEANIRLAALMKLGFTTGQIAVMQGISPTSVTKAKQRLKARLK